MLVVIETKILFYATEPHGVDPGDQFHEVASRAGNDAHCVQLQVSFFFTVLLIVKLKHTPLLCVIAVHWLVRRRRGGG